MKKDSIVVKILTVLLWLIALHSFLAGLGLIVLPEEIIGFFGFTQPEHSFFRVQAGVFHMVMSLVYCFAALDQAKYRDMVLFTVIAKYMGTIFLMTYYLFFDRIWMVLISGILDFIMGSAVFALLYYQIKKERQTEL